MLLLLSPICKLIHPLNSKLLQLIKTLKAMLSISEGVAKYNKVILEGYIKFINIALILKLYNSNIYSFID
jgi:hypothetical protein